MNDELKRAIEMLRLAADYIDEYYLDGIIFYDKADCDGYCLIEDLITAAEMLENCQ